MTQLLSTEPRTWATKLLEPTPQERTLPAHTPPARAVLACGGEGRRGEDVCVQYPLQQEYELQEKRQRRRRRRRRDRRRRRRSAGGHNSGVAPGGDNSGDIVGIGENGGGIGGGGGNSGGDDSSAVSPHTPRHPTRHPTRLSSPSLLQDRRRRSHMSIRPMEGTMCPLASGSAGKLRASQPRHKHRGHRPAGPAPCAEQSENRCPLSRSQAARVRFWGRAGWPNCATEAVDGVAHPPARPRRAAAATVVGVSRARRGAALPPPTPPHGMPELGVRVRIAAARPGVVGTRGLAASALGDRRIFPLPGLSSSERLAGRATTRPTPMRRRLLAAARRGGASCMTGPGREA